MVMDWTPKGVYALALSRAKEGRVELAFTPFLLVLMHLDDPTQTLEERKAFITGSLSDGNVELSDDVQAYLVDG